MITLRLTDAGRAAIMGAAKRQIRNVQIRSLAIGTGTGPGGADDDVRTTLRAEIARAAPTTASPSTAGRIVVRGDFAPASHFTVTEVGLVARIGGSGAEFLLAYGAVPSAAAAIAAAVPGVVLIVVAVLEATHALADIPVSVGAPVTLGDAADRYPALTDTPDDYIAARYARVNAAGDAMLWDEAPPTVATEAALPGGATQAQSVFLVQNYAATGYPALALHSGGAWRYCLSLPAHAVNSHARAGLAELATLAEHTTASPPDDRLATPAGAREQIRRMLVAANLARTTRYDTQVATRRETEGSTRRETSRTTDVPATRSTQRETSRTTEVAATRSTQRETSRTTDVPSTRSTRRTTSRTTEFITTRSTRRETSRTTDVAATRSTRRETSRTTDVAATRSTRRETSRTTEFITTYYVYDGRDAPETHIDGHPRRKRTRTTRRTTRFDTTFDTDLTVQRQTRYDTTFGTDLTVQRQTRYDTTFDTDRTVQRQTRYGTTFGTDLTVQRQTRYGTAADTDITVERQTRYGTAADTDITVERQTRYGTAAVTTKVTEFDTQRETARVTRL